MQVCILQPLCLFLCELQLYNCVFAIIYGGNPFIFASYDVDSGDLHSDSTYMPCYNILHLTVKYVDLHQNNIYHLCLPVVLLYECVPNNPVKLESKIRSIMKVLEKTFFQLFSTYAHNVTNLDLQTPK